MATHSICSYLPDPDGSAAAASRVTNEGHAQRDSECQSTGVDYSTQTRLDAI